MPLEFRCPALSAVISEMLRPFSPRRHSLPGETEPLLTVPTSFLEAPEAFQTPPHVTVETELSFPDSVMDSDSGELLVTWATDVR